MMSPFKVIPGNNAHLPQMLTTDGKARYQTPFMELFQIFGVQKRIYDVMIAAAHAAQPVSFDRLPPSEQELVQNYAPVIEAARNETLTFKQGLMTTILSGLGRHAAFVVGSPGGSSLTLEAHHNGDGQAEIDGLSITSGGKTIAGIVPDEKTAQAIVTAVTALKLDAASLNGTTFSNSAAPDLIGMMSEAYYRRSGMRAEFLQLLAQQAPASPNGAQGFIAGATHAPVP